MGNSHVIYTWLIKETVAPNRAIAPYTRTESLPYTRTESQYIWYTVYQLKAEGGYPDISLAAQAGDYVTRAEGSGQRMRSMQWLRHKSRRLWATHAKHAVRAEGSINIDYPDSRMMKHNYVSDLLYSPIVLV